VFTECNALYQSDGENKEEWVTKVKGTSITNTAAVLLLA
jgi:hypothetical protein